MRIVPTIFGDVTSKNVVFVIDTSGSMYNALPTIKQHLIEALQAQSQLYPDSRFNIIEFSTRVTQWTDRLVKCTSAAVKAAESWIRNLTPKTGTNTLDALLAALGDPGCDAVVLVTDGLPDQRPEEILDHVSFAGQGRPIHAIYIAHTETDTIATTFLHQLAFETRGTFRVVKITQHGHVERITPVYESKYGQANSLLPKQPITQSDKTCTVDATINSIPHTLGEEILMAGRPCMLWPAQRGNLIGALPLGWSRLRPVQYASPERALFWPRIPISPAAGTLLVGRRVLARRHADGLFYHGTIKSQIVHDKFLVEFGPCDRGKFTLTSYQETLVHDIIHLDDALRHSIIPGDKVLAPIDPGGQIYSPGVVLEGVEKRFGSGSSTDNDLTIAFTNGRTEKVGAGKSVWIPLALHDRVSLELNMPKEARRDLEREARYPVKSMAGYPTSGPQADPPEYEFSKIHPNSCLLPYAYPTPPFYPLAPVYPHPYVPIHPIMYKYNQDNPVVHSARGDDIERMVAPDNGVNGEKSEVNEKVMQQLLYHKMLLEDDNARKSKSFLPGFRRLHLPQRKEFSVSSAAVEKENSAEEEKREIRDLAKRIGDEVRLSDGNVRPSRPKSRSRTSSPERPDSGGGSRPTRDSGFSSRSEGSPEKLTRERRAHRRLQASTKESGDDDSIFAADDDDDDDYELDDDRPRWRYSARDKIPPLIAPNSHDAFKDPDVGDSIELREPLFKINSRGILDWSDSHYEGPVDHSRSDIDWEGKKMAASMAPDLASGEQRRRRGAAHNGRLIVGPNFGRNANDRVKSREGIEIGAGDSGKSGSIFRCEKPIDSVQVARKSVQDRLEKEMDLMRLKRQTILESKERRQVEMAENKEMVKIDGNK